MSGFTGLDMDKLEALKAIARNTEMIAIELTRIRGMLELIYKNGITTYER